LRLLGGLGILLVCIFTVAYFFYGLQPVSFATGESGTSAAATVKEFRIAKGDGFKEIAATLSRESLIQSIAVFKLYTLITGRAQDFQPGIYEVSTAMSVPEIVSLMTRGGMNEISVTVPEGSTLKDIQTQLAGVGIAKDREFGSYDVGTLAAEYPFLKDATSLEGFLFPDTYRFRPDASADEVLDVFLSTFERKAWPLLQGKRDWYETLVLASLLEREVPEFNDREIVAGILLKRLDRGIPLQVDATVSYVKCDGAPRNCDGATVTKADLKIASPYNTYQHLGFPPTPISNPGQSAMQAARDPEASPYLYYLSASTTKETIFSRTLEEHNANRARYL
jgi:UPF0755 protein